MKPLFTNKQLIALKLGQQLCCPVPGVGQDAPALMVAEGEGLHHVSWPVVQDTAGQDYPKNLQQ